MGRFTISPIGIQTRPDPSNPGQMQISFALGAGAQVLASKGIVLNVGIGVDNFTADALHAQNLPLPQPFNGPALVDTGASGLALDTSVVRQLGLLRQGIANNYTAAGPRVSPVYFVSLAFPGSQLNSYGLLRATEVDLTGQAFKCLIGRETMMNWHIHYNGQSGQISIAD